MPPTLLDQARDASETLPWRVTQGANGGQSDYRDARRGIWALLVWLRDAVI
jgi:hypothetical protein